MLDFGIKARMDRGRKPMRPRLDRRNAAKNIDYAAADDSWRSSSTASVTAVDEIDGLSPSTLRTTRSLDLSPAACSSQTSFRIGGGVEGEFDLLCRSLGLSGPDDFAISASVWLAHKSHHPSPSDPSPIQIRVRDEPPSEAEAGIRGARPPILSPPPSRSAVLAPPPPMSCPVLDKTSSTWDILRSFAPEDGEDNGAGTGSFNYDDEEEEEEVPNLAADEAEFSASYSFSTSNDDDSSSTTTNTEAMFVISPNASFRRNIRSWMRGAMLGSGSYGTVFEGISDDGFFFAVKEVSLLDQGSNAKQCIFQLEQEIALLSQFEHENIVQYYGTDKEEAKLFIFIELVTQGSLASLYQKYHLRDSQVSAYTRQILKGLKYLHDRNVVHRDIKCANILVHASGSVKLADFGLAKEITKFNMLKSCKGSVYWMAPEVVNPKRTYGPSADVWSLGCTVLEMLTRQIPYPNLEWTQALFRIGRGEKPPIPNSLSRDARDFISQCVQVTPDDRPSAAQLLEHPFVRRSLSASEGSELSSHGHDRQS